MVGPELAGKRLDVALARLEPSLSRAQVQRLIEQGEITVAGGVAKPARKLRAGERIEGRVPEPVPARLEPQAIPLVILHEDADLVVVDKPAGMVVHPAAGHAQGTLVNALLHHCRDLSGVGGELRPGIVHRIDKDTSGLLVAAKHDRAHRALAAQWKQHSIDREYLAFVRGSPRAESGTVDAAIGRHPTDRKRMSTRARVGRSAVTHWRVEERLREATLLRVRLETGRTHQIRVHMASIALPLLGDPIYGGGRVPRAALAIARQALHATVLGFTHPTTGERVRFESELPPDLRALLESLR